MLYNHSCNKGEGYSEAKPSNSGKKNKEQWSKIVHELTLYKVSKMRRSNCPAPDFEITAEIKVYQDADIGKESSADAALNTCCKEQGWVWYTGLSIWLVQPMGIVAQIFLVNGCQ